MTAAAVGLATSFVGSLLGFVVALHYDLEGRWAAGHARRGARKEAKDRARRGLPAEPEA